MSQRFITNENGERIAVILSIEDYEELLEDLHDLAVIAERKNEPTISLEELKQSLKRDGYLHD
jgi:PHD/YefM family antitoxin component YafN of YafNO toxin-antitoxin module